MEETEGLATSRVRLADDGGGCLLTGVSSLRFVFTDPNEAGDETVHREVDVFGGVVPESHSACWPRHGPPRPASTPRPLRQ